MYNLPMVVYGEMLFIENMIIGWVLLYLTGEICGRKAGGRGTLGRGLKGSIYKWRLFVGSIMCGAFSLVIFLEAKAPVMILMEVCFALAVCTAAFEPRGQRNAKPALRCCLTWIPWRHAITFILVTYFMGGMTMGLLLLTRNQGIYTAAGIYTGDMKAAILTVFILLGYLTVTQIIKTVRKTKLYSENSYDVTICCGERTIEVKAFLDTGNHLKDPVTGKPVAVASETLWSSIQKHRAGLKKADAFLDGAEHSNFVLVPYETVGARGLLEGIRVDYIDVGRRRIRGCIVARGGRLFHCSQQKYELLLAAEMAGADSSLSDIKDLKGETG